MRRLHCLTWSSSSSWNYGLRTKKGMFPECFVASFQSRGLPSSAPPCRSCIFCFSERYFAAQLSGRRACQCPVHRPKCQQEEPISLSIPKAMVHKISFDSISGSAGASEIYLDIFCPLGGYDQVRRHLCDSDPSNNITKESELRAFEGSFQPDGDGANLEALMVSAA